MISNLQKRFNSIFTSTLATSPFVYISIFFIIGILLFKSIEYTIPIHTSLFLISIFSIACIGISYLIKKINLYILLIWFIGFGYFCANSSTLKYDTLVGYKTIRATIKSPLQEKNKTFKAEISHETTNVKLAQAIIYIQKDSLSKNLKYGDVVEFTANFKSIENNPKTTFNYKAYLANKHIYSQAYVSAKSWHTISHTSSIQSYSFSIREKALQILRNSGISNENFDVLAALVFGDKSFLDSNITQAFTIAGVTHILSVSGLHVGIISTILIFLFSFFKKYKLTQTILCVSGIWAYAYIAGMCPSIERAAIMASMVAISILLQRNSSIFNTLSVAAFISLLINPNDLFDIGFQLSYLAVIGIGYFTPIFQKLYISKNSIYSYIWGIIAVSIGVQLTTLPISLYYFHSFPTYSFIANIIIIPLSFIILANAIIILIVFSIPFVSNLFSYTLDQTSSYLYNVVFDIVSFPYAQIPIQINYNQMILLYGIIIIGILIFETLKELRIQKQIFL